MDYISVQETAEKWNLTRLATQDGNGVKTRVFQYLFADGNKVYFCTSSQKPVYDQLMANPNASFCTIAPGFNPVLSVNGKAVFEEDLALKARALDENPGINGINQAPDNPVFKIFYIDATEVETFSFAGGRRTTYCNTVIPFADRHRRRHGPRRAN